MGDINEACLQIYNAYATWGTFHMSQNITGFQLTGQDLTSVLGPEGAHGATVVGGDTGTDLPLSASAVISWQAGRHYRGGHPRTYIYGLTVNSAADNRSISNAFGTSLDTLANDILSNLAGGTYTRSPAPTLVSVHRVQHGVILTTPLVDKITGHVIHPRLDTQRRRLGKE